jgi:hypothetical protein
MITNLKSHKAYYLLLAGMQAAGFILVLFAKGDKQLVMMYIIMSTCFYFIWALAHHYVNHDLHAKVVLEYLLMSILGITVMYFFLW